MFIIASNEETIQDNNIISNIISEELFKRGRMAF